jgi:hypothetical protein
VEQPTVDVAYLYSQQAANRHRRHHCRPAYDGARLRYAHVIPPTKAEEEQSCVPRPEAFTDYYASGAVRMKVPVVLEFRDSVLGVYK